MLKFPQGFDEDAQEVNFEKRGDVYSDVISLLRHKSAKFTENIDKQVTNDVINAVFTECRNNVVGFDAS